MSRKMYKEMLSLLKRELVDGLSQEQKLDIINEIENQRKEGMSIDAILSRMFEATLKTVEFADTEKTLTDTQTKEIAASLTDSLLNSLVEFAAIQEGEPYNGTVYH